MSGDDDRASAGTEIDRVIEVEEGREREGGRDEKQEVETETGDCGKKRGTEAKGVG